MDLLVEFYMTKDVIYMLDTAKLKEGLRKYVGGTVLTTESLFTELLKYMISAYQKSNTDLKSKFKNDEIAANAMAKKLTDATTEFAEKDLTDLLSNEELKGKADGKDAETVIAWAKEWGTKFVKECKDKCKEIKITEDENANIKNFITAIKNVDSDYTKKRAIYKIYETKYWKNMKKYFGGEEKMTYEEVEKSKPKEEPAN